MVNSGMKAATMIAVEKNTARSTCSALARMIRSRSVQAGRPAKSLPRVGSAPHFALGELPQQRLPCFRARLEIPIDVFDQDHRGIDDDAEIDGADRQQIGVLAAQDQDDDAEEQRERNVAADDDRAAQVAEEQPLDEEDQQAAEEQIVQHGAVVTSTSVVRS